MATELDRATILAALTRLNELLREQGVLGELCLLGGTVMVLAFNARASTKDVDAIFQPAEVIRAGAAHPCANAVPNRGHLQPLGGLPMKRPASLAEVSAWAADGASFHRHLADLLDEFRLRREPTMLAEEPARLTDRFEKGEVADAYLAAVAVALAREIHT